MFKTFRTLATATVAATLTAGIALAGSPNWGSTYHYVAPGGEIVLNEVFYGGELAVIELNGDGASDVDLYVYDENGNFIGSSTSAGPFERVTFEPIWTGDFEIRVVNYGTYRGSSFELWAN